MQQSFLVIFSHEVSYIYHKNYFNYYCDRNVLYKRIKLPEYSENSPIRAANTCRLTGGIQHGGVVYVLL